MPTKPGRNFWEIFMDVNQYNMNESVIYDHHWGGGSTKRWIAGKYLVSATFSTGSTIYVETLDHPGVRENGWFYMAESVDECVSRLISKIENGWKHACWRENNGSYYGKPKYIDQLSEEKIKEIEDNPNFSCWEYISEYKWGKFVKKTVYNPNKYAYENFPHQL